jgi:hypothetical protein
MDEPTCPAFHLEEYRALRAEIAAGEAEIAQIERLVGVACAAIWVWIFGATQHPELKALGFVPTLVVLFGWIRASALYASILRIAAYLRKLESRYACPPLTGWERHMEQQRKVAERLRRIRNRHRKLCGIGAFTMGTSSVVYWSGLAVSTLLLGLAYAFGN